MKSNKKSGSQPKAQSYKQAIRDRRFTDNSNQVQEAINKYNLNKQRG